MHPVIRIYKASASCLFPMQRISDLHLIYMEALLEIYHGLMTLMEAAWCFTGETQMIYSLRFDDRSISLAIQFY